MPADDKNGRHLWFGPRDHGDDHDWLEPQPEPTRVHEPAPTEPAAARKPRRRRPLATMLAVLALVLGGLFVGSQLEKNSGSTSANVVTLPVVKGTTPETRAGEIYRATQEGIVQLRTGDASGTGFVVDKNGTIVTNAHVVDGASTVRVVFDDGVSSVEGKVLGSDVSADLAVVKVDPSQVKVKFVALALADSDDVQTGDDVIAVGYPLGLDRTATQGIISGIGRQIQAQNGFSIDKVLQTDASINPGNSGGPLLDAKGRVIGVNSQIAATASGSNTGIGFAIPSNTVRQVIPSLVAGKAIDRPYLGVSLADTTDDSGAGVAAVTAGGPGAEAGLQGAENGGTGDVITAVNGKAIDGPDQLISQLNKYKPGEVITLDVTRNGKGEKIKVTVGSRPSTAATSSSSSGSGGSGGSGGGSGIDPNSVIPTTPDNGPQQSPFNTP